jgi:hypothetical protein
MNEWIYEMEWVYDRMYGWIEWMDGWMDGIDGWMGLNECMNKWIMDGWMDDWLMDKWVEMSEWMD